MGIINLAHDGSKGVYGISSTWKGKVNSMNVTEAQAIHATVDSAAVKRMEGGLLGEAIGSIAVIALAIAGLAGVWSMNIAAIAVIVLAAAILIAGGVFTEREMLVRRGELASTELLAGLTGIVLGILALLGTAPGTLISVATIVFGACLLFSRMVDGAFGSRMLVGIGAVVLGILAVVGLSQTTLVLVALLCLGAMELFAGVENATRLAALQRSHSV